MLYKRTLPWLWAILIAGLGLFAAASPLWAHGSTTVGPYTLIVGWVNEPPLVSERNAVLLIVTNEETGEPVTGVEASLDAEVIYGGKTFRANLNPTTTPGEYTLELIPTVRGQYNLHLFGSIGSTEVEITVEPEEVFAAARLQFPEPEPESIALAAQITTLETQLQQARTLAFIGIGLGIIGLLLGFISLRFARK